MNKVVLITGATRNTGLATARRFAAEGWDVAITSREQTGASAAAHTLAREFSIAARGYGMDLESVTSIRDIFTQVHADFGHLDAFVANSAHLGVDYSLLNTDEPAFDSIVDVNLKGNFFCCQRAARLMMASGGGSIVTIGSVQGTGALHGRTVYGMTKAALSMLTRYMAYELGQYGIRANNVIAGAIHSTRWDDLSPEEIAQRRSRYPAGRESTESEVAAAVYYLCSDQAAKQGTLAGKILRRDHTLAHAQQTQGGSHALLVPKDYFPAAEQVAVGLKTE